MMTLEAIRMALQDRRLNIVATETGLHYNTLRILRDNPNANPSYKVIKALTEYLQSGATQNG